MATTDLQKQMNKKNHCEHFPGLPPFRGKPWGNISWCPHPSLRHSSWHKRTEAFRKLTVGQNRLEHSQNRLFLCPKRFKCDMTVLANDSCLHPAWMPWAHTHTGRQSYCLPATFATPAVHWVQLIIAEAISYYAHINNCVCQWKLHIQKLRKLA